MDPVYNQRRQFIKTIPKFWPTALFRHAGLAIDLKNEEDIKALQYLTDIWVSRNPVEPRVYTIQFVSTIDFVIFTPFVHDFHFCRPFRRTHTSKIRSFRKCTNSTSHQAGGTSLQIPRASNGPCSILIGMKM